MTKSKLTGGGGGLGAIYRYNSYVLECHPFNYTTKLSDCLDSLRYLQGSLLGGSVSANSSYNFFRLFCRGYDDECFYKQEIAEPGSFKAYDFIVFEICSLSNILITTTSFGSEFNGLFLPWNINVEACHQKFSPNADEFKIINPSLREIEVSMDSLVELAGCPIMVIGPYLLPYEPTGRALHGENDFVPINKINSHRHIVRNTLRTLCNSRGVQYFDMTEYIKRDPSLLRNQYHFSPIGENILFNAICQGAKRAYA